MIAPSAGADRPGPATNRREGGADDRRLRDGVRSWPDSGADDRRFDHWGTHGPDSCATGSERHVRPPRSHVTCQSRRRRRCHLPGRPGIALRPNVMTTSGRHDTTRPGVGPGFASGRGARRCRTRATSGLAQRRSARLQDEAGLAATGDGAAGAGLAAAGAELATAGDAAGKLGGAGCLHTATPSYCRSTAMMSSCAWTWAWTSATGTSCGSLPGRTPSTW